jgi:hypothetical protein
MGNTLKSIILVMLLIVSMPLYSGSRTGSMTLYPGNIVDLLAKENELRGKSFYPSEFPLPEKDLYISVDNIDNEAFRRLGYDILDSSLPSENSWTMGGKLGVKQRTTDNTTGKGYLKGRLGAGFRQGNLGIIGAYDIDVGYMDDPLFYGKKWEGKSVGLNNHT